MRNGVLAITRDGRIALLNDEAYRIFGLESKAEHVGGAFGEVLRDHPEVVRVLATVFDVDLLPNRVELRLKPSGMVIGYTLALVRNDDGDVIGAAMFFKDLTRVEQLVERTGMSPRALQRLFREYVGVTPKWVLQRLRLHEAAERMIDGAGDWASLALDLGYFDQAHFIADFRKLVGTTPAEYARAHGRRE